MFHLMMSMGKTNNNRWSSGDLEVRVLHSIAGLATQIIILHKGSGESLLLDCGDGTTRDLVKHKVNMEKIVAIALSHGHYDHCGGLHSLLGFLRMIGRESSLHIIFPSESSEITGLLANFEECYNGSIPFPLRRLGDGERPNGKISFGVWAIEAIPMIHYGSTVGFGTGAQVPALGYRVVADGVSIAYSGDTGPNANLSNLFAAGTDLGIVEASHPNESWIQDHSHRYHLTVDEAENATRACNRAMIVHRLPQSVIRRRTEN